MNDYYAQMIVTKVAAERRIRDEFQRDYPHFAIIEGSGSEELKIHALRLLSGH